MTLEEAMDDRQRKYKIWGDMPESHPDRMKAHQAWWDAYCFQVRLQMLWDKSPTQQLCMLAQIINKETPDDNQ